MDSGPPPPQTLPGGAESTPLALPAGGGSSSRGKVIVISGPTASGKSRLALRLAKLLDGEVISADSVQVYRGMDIGSAKTPPHERQGVPHHLLDVLEPTEECTAGDFFTLARAATEDVLRRGKVPIVVGGTGLYLRWYLYGKPDTPRVCAEAAAEVEAEVRGYEAAGEAGWAAALAALAGAGDPATGRQLARNDWYRLKRALEIVRATGRSKSDFVLPWGGALETPAPSGHWQGAARPPPGTAAAPRPAAACGQAPVATMAPPPGATWHGEGPPLVQWEDSSELGSPPESAPAAGRRRDHRQGGAMWRSPGGGAAGLRDAEPDGAEVSVAAAAERDGDATLGGLPPAADLDFDFRCFFLSAPRMELYERIDSRCEEMVAGGLLQEVDRMLAAGVRPNSNPASRSIGYRQAIEYLVACRSRGGCSMEGEFLAFLGDVQKASRNYAKRQLTWFRAERLYRWLDASQPTEALADAVISDFQGSSTHGLPGPRAEWKPSSGAGAEAITACSQEAEARWRSYEEGKMMKQYRTALRIFNSSSAIQEVLGWIEATERAQEEHRTDLAPSVSPLSD